MVSEQAICGISSKRIVGATHGGSSCGWHPDLYSGGVYGGGARHLFDETPSHREATTGDVLRVTVSHVLYPVTEGVLHQVFDLYGAEQVVVLERADHVEALVRFRSSRDAERARDVTHGRCVYDGCCWLDVQYMQSIPSDSIVVMPVTCSTLGLSPNTDVSMATTTSAATTLTTSTTSAAATMTSLVTRAREAPRDELKELAPVETSKEPKKTVKEMCEKILATLNSMIEGGRDINLDITSNVVEAAGYNVVSLPTFPTTVELSDIIVSSPMPPVIADSVLDQDSASHKVLEERSDMSTVVLWPPPMKWDERQLWPPPSRVVIKCIVGSNLIPIAKSLFGLSSGSLFGLLTFSSKKGLYDVQGPIPIVKNVSIPPDSDDILLVNLEDIMPLCYFWVPVDSCKNRIAEALDTIKPISSWEMTTTASQVQDHALDHTRGFGVVVDALVNYLSLEYGIMFELARIFAFLSGPPNYGAGLFAFQEMKKAGVNSDVYTYTILIDSFCKAGLIEHAQSWFDEMRSVSCSPNVVTYTALLHAYLKAKQLLLANDIFHRMVDAGCRPNGITYSALIDGLCKSETIAPNVVTYGALIDGLCKAHKVADAHELLDAMLSAGCEPNHIIYDALIDGFCKVGKIDNAQEVFLRMTKCGYLPSLHTYTSLIDRMFKDGRLDLAMKVLSQMLKDSCTPNVVTYTAMVDGLCRIGESEKALKLLSLMEEKGCSPNVVTYTALIDGLGKAGKVDVSLKLFTQMSTKGCAPNYVTYRVLINHCCAAGLLDKAHLLLDEMKQTCWPKYLQGYRCAVQGFSKKFIASLGLLEEMESHGTVPIAPVYGMLIDSFSRAGRLETALELHKQMMEVSSSLNMTSMGMYASLIRALCLASQVQEAFELYSEMTRRGLVPELSVFVCLIKGLIQVNKWNEALQLCYGICHEGVKWQGNKSFDGG